MCSVQEAIELIEECSEELNLLGERIEERSIQETMKNWNCTREWAVKLLKVSCQSKDDPSAASIAREYGQGRYMGD